MRGCRQSARELCDPLFSSLPSPTVNDLLVVSVADRPRTGRDGVDPSTSPRSGSRSGAEWSETEGSSELESRPGSSDLDDSDADWRTRKTNDTSDSQGRTRKARDTTAGSADEVLVARHGLLHERSPASACSPAPRLGSTLANLG